MRFNSLLIFFLIILFSGRLIASEDTLSAPTYKIYIQGTLSLITSVKPTEGQFYSKYWNDTEKPKTRTGGTHLGLNAAIKMSKESYLVTGTEIFWFKFGNFRLTPAPDLRYSNPNLTYYDTSYGDHKQTIIQVPLCIQFPVIPNIEYFVFQLGIINNFTFSESYSIFYKQSVNGSIEYTTKSMSKNAIYYTDTRLITSIGYDSVKNNVIVNFSSGITSGPILTNHEKENFLSYSFSFFIRMGVGYTF